MKRMHIHVGVENLDKSIEFYNQLFDQSPDKTQSDYAKWMLDDPRVNFAISTRPPNPGVNHLGLQVDTDSELQDLRDRARRADLTLVDEGETTCCYARADKSWLEDPSGVAWEAYRTMEDTALFGSAPSANETD